MQITQSQKNKLDYVDNLHKLTDKQKLAKEYELINKARKRKLEILERMRSNNSNNIRLHDFYIKNRKVHDVTKLSEEQIEREVEF